MVMQVNHADRGVAAMPLEPVEDCADAETMRIALNRSCRTAAPAEQQALVDNARGLVAVIRAGVEPNPCGMVRLPRPATTVATCGDLGQEREIVAATAADA